MLSLQHQIHIKSNVFTHHLKFDYMAEDFYTVEQVAEKLNCHPRTVRDLIKNDEIKASKKLRKWYVLHSDLLEYIKSK